MTTQETIARILCRLMDDEWHLGRDLYMRTADEILLASGHAQMSRCLAFFASVIKCGEPWTETCQRKYDAAVSLHPLPSKQD